MERFISRRSAALWLVALAGLAMPAMAAERVVLGEEFSAVS